MDRFHSFVEVETWASEELSRKSVAVIWPPPHRYRAQLRINATEMQLKREKGPNIE